ncbi:MAG TPA: 3-phosphoshikimate 1-carboxyvinyltransferase [bacterium]|nr:3-phosphoshikimate 1-carboxyvinyltransferase [bacterium]
MKQIKFDGELQAKIQIPGSKYIANRALPLAALSEGTSLIRNIPLNNDIMQAIKAFRKLGVKIELDGNQAEVEGTAGHFSQIDTEIDCGESGTLMRFITAFATLVGDNIRITGSARIMERPVGELVDGLIQLGARIDRENGECPPVVIKSNRLKGGKTRIDGSKSSQFISALLLVAAYAQKDVEIEILGKSVSSSYIDLTCELIKKFGGNIEQKNSKHYFVKSDQKYKARNYTIPTDWSTANFFFAAAAITGGKVSIDNLDLQTSQGESGFVDVLEKMGCSVEKKNNSVTLEGTTSLKGINIDMSSLPDAVPALAAVSVFCQEDVRIRNISHLRYKECDRIKALEEELSKLEANISSSEDELIIRRNGWKKKPVTFDPRNDHRIAMSMALLGLRIPNIKIDNPECVDKSFPGFWSKLQEIGAQVSDVK